MQGGELAPGGGWAVWVWKHVIKCRYEPCPCHLFHIGWVEDGVDFLCGPGACRSSLHVRQDEQNIAALIRCRWDNGSGCDLPIYANFGPQNITVIMSQEAHYWHAFFDWIYKNPFSTSSKLWLLGRIILRWKGLEEEIAAPLESMEVVQ